MVYSPTSQGTEPWIYAYVVAIFHLFACTGTDPNPKRLEILWVRWMKRDSLQLSGANSSQFTRISFVLHSGVPGEAFGFVDPSHIIRTCHLIPVFNLGRTRDQLNPSMARDVNGDWQAFYANRCDLCFGPACIPLVLTLLTDLLIAMHLRDLWASGLAVSGYKLPGSWR